MELLRFLALQAGIGFGLSALLVLGVVAADQAGLLLSEGPGPALLLWVFAGVTLGGAQIGAALMLANHPGAR